MEDLTQYSDQELSLRVFNDEYFYIERHNFDHLVALCREVFIFNAGQLGVLVEDVTDDLEGAA